MLAERRFELNRVDFLSRISEIHQRVFRLDIEQHRKVARLKVQIHYRGLLLRHVAQGQRKVRGQRRNSHATRSTDERADYAVARSLGAPPGLAYLQQCPRGVGVIEW